MEGFWTFVADLGRPIAAACLNVGVGVGGAFADTDLDDELRMIAINCTGLVHMAKRVVRSMLDRGEGDRRILVAGRGQPGHVRAREGGPQGELARPS